ncbi:MAG TPA: HAMP domain-containing sensor histidine kinase [Candidatus Limnocylindria bacterium]|nr:HAMP domain-containing sensor histidine kinase [Candidatus Limnocylindria bacterium]
MTLKIRLALWYGSFFAVVLAAALFATYTEHSAAHLADHDAALRDAWRSAADVVTRTLDTTGPQDTLLHDVLDTSDSGIALFLFDAHGGVLASADRPRLQGLTEVAATAPDGYSTAAAVDGHLRLLAGPLKRATGTRLVAVTSLAALDASLARLRGYLLLLAVIGIAVAVSGGLALSGSALRPIALVTETARSIATSQAFSRRVATPPRDDEVGRLARTFNAMLDSLEAAYARQQRFVGDASHELRTPLAAMRTHVALLARGGEDGDRPELLHRIEREVERLCDLVDDLLTLSRADAAAEPVIAKAVQLDEVLMEVFEGLRAREAPRLAVAALDVAPVMGERDRLVQLILILIDNALRYTPADGHVTVSLSVGGHAAELRVEDDGIGIDPAESARLFDRFYRGAAARRMHPSGSGLGLAIARWIVQRHGGTITIEPREPRGTRAVVRLPLAVEMAAPAPVP